MDDLAAPASVAGVPAAECAFAEVVGFVADAAAPLVASGLHRHSASAVAGAPFLVAAGVFVALCLVAAEVSAAVAGIFDRVSRSRYWKRPADSSAEARWDALRSGDRLHRREAGCLLDLPADCMSLPLHGRQQHPGH